MLSSQHTLSNNIKKKAWLGKGIPIHSKKGLHASNPIYFILLTDTNGRGTDLFPKYSVAALRLP